MEQNTLLRNVRATPEEQDKLHYGGASFIGDFARQSGGNVLLSNEELKCSGAGFWADMARQGGQVVTP